MCTATKWGKVVFLILVLPFIINAGGQNTGRITFIMGGPGDIQLKRVGQDRWTNARIYQPVVSGDQIQTRSEARCEIRMRDYSIIRVGENSRLTISDQQEKSQRKSVLSFGKIWMNIKKLAQRQTFYVQTPTAVCSIRGTIFRVETDSTTKVGVYDGIVDVGPQSMLTNESGPAMQQPQTRSLKPQVVPGPHEIPPPFEVTLDQWVQIVKGYQIEIRADGKYAKTKIDSMADAQQDWVKWNTMRDEMNR